MDSHNVLDVPYNADQRTVKRAYAALIKQFRPDSHPTEFARIRLAYEDLMERCRYRQQYEEDNAASSLESDNQEKQAESNDLATNTDISEVIYNAEYDYYDFQSENDCENFERLVEKPFIQLPETEESENPIDPYSRLVDKPIVQPLLSPAEETKLIDYLELETHKRYDHLIDKPVIEQTITEQTKPDADELAWIEQPEVNIIELINQLRQFILPADEQLALDVFQTQLRDNFPVMNLDQRMDYEEKLYYNLIFNDLPPLLLFAAANDYFNWENSASWIKSAQSKWNRQRFDALNQLSRLYRHVRQRYNPFFQAEDGANNKSVRLTTRYRYAQAEEQREEWLCLCHSANLKDLALYFSETPKLKPLYIMDILWGALLSYGILIEIVLEESFSYPMLSEYYQLAVWLISIPAIGIGFLFAWLLLGWRALDDRFKKGTKWTLACISIALLVILPQDIGAFIYIAFFLAFILKFLYSQFTNLELRIAKILTRLSQTVKNKKHPPTPHSQKPQTTMNKQIYPLLIAQFLSAFADNAILFTVIAMVMKSANQTSWYVPALQSAFLIAYVVLGPWVGGIADRHAKARVLLVANIIKAVGAGLLFVNIEPLLAYGIVGVGAAIYSPAKYGILPELVGHASLVKANSWIEGSTILAILLGMKIGAEVADHSIQLALLGTIVLFIISALATLSLPVNISKNDSEENALLEFGKQMAAFFTTPRSRFSVLGGSLFWAAAASLRVILIAWAPLVLLSKNASEIADLTLYLTVGIIAGSIIVPRLIPLEQLRRARIPAYLMAILIAGLSLTTDAVSAQAVLFAIGTMGGLFIVPINAALQEQGQQTIGSGSAVALQNFFQNLAMLLAVGAYTVSAAQHVNPTTAMLTLGCVMFATAFLVSLCLPAQDAK